MKRPKVVTAILQKVAQLAKPTPTRLDPWYSDAERRSAVNQRAASGGWVPRRPGWLRSRRERGE